MPVVQIEGVGNVQFPDSMSSTDIGTAAHKLYTGAAAKTIEANPPGVADPRQQVAASMPEIRSAESVIPRLGMTPSQASAAARAPQFHEDPSVAGMGLAGTALAVGAAVAPSLAVAGAKKVAPYILPAVGSLAINKAKELPVVGPIIKHIPYAEMLPWLFAGGSEKAEKAEAEGGAKIEPGSTDQIPGRPYQPNPRYQPRPEPAEILPRQGPLLLQGKVAPQKREPFNAEMPFGGQEPIMETAPVEKTPIVAGSKADILETRGIQERVREAGEREDRQRLSQAKSDWFKRNGPQKTKGELTGTAKTPSNPIAGKRMDYAGSSGTGAQIPGVDEDLTPILRKSPAAARKAKAD